MHSLIALYLELYFLVNWCDDKELYDMMPSKVVVPPEETNILEVMPEV